MEAIKVYDKTFVPYIANDELMKSIDDVAAKLNADHEGTKEVPIVLCVLNGAMMFTSELLKRIDFDCELMSVKVKSYEGTQSTGKIKEAMGVTGSVKGREVIIVEDIIDTGKTIDYLHGLLNGLGASSIKICTMLFKPDAYCGVADVDYIAKSIPDKFILGFGLDYNELGRNYKDIYILSE